MVIYNASFNILHIMAHLLPLTTLTGSRSPIETQITWIYYAMITSKVIIVVIIQCSPHAHHNSNNLLHRYMPPVVPAQCGGSFFVISSSVRVQYVCVHRFVSLWIVRVFVFSSGNRFACRAELWADKTCVGRPSSVHRPASTIEKKFHTWLIVN